MAPHGVYRCPGKPHVCVSDFSHPRAGAPVFRTDDNFQCAIKQCACAPRALSRHSWPAGRKMPCRVQVGGGTPCDGWSKSTSHKRNRYLKRNGVSSYLRMLHHLGDYADPSSDCAGLSKDPFLRPSSIRTGGGAYVAHGLFAAILARPQHVRLGANSRNCGLSGLAGSCASPAR